MLPPPAKKDISIIYADDHQLVREAICSYIKGFAGFKVVGSVADGMQLITLIQDGLIPDIVVLDIVVLDIEMPVLNGYDTAKWVAVNYPDIKILILTTFDTEAARSIAFCNGAHAFSSKNIDQREMEDVLNRLTASAIISESSPLHSVITEKEQFFLKWICTDKTYEEIADCMNISLRQVERIRGNLFEKWAINNRTSLAVFAVKQGVIIS